LPSGILVHLLEDSLAQVLSRLERGGEKLTMIGLICP
jgi:hypothetical protein